MARLRNDNAAALIPDRTRELAEIADWYRRALADEPARRWNTGPTLIGPTWKRGCLCSMVLRPVERLVFSPKER